MQTLPSNYCHPTTIIQLSSNNHPPIIPIRLSSCNASRTIILQRAREWSNKRRRWRRGGGDRAEPVAERTDHGYRQKDRQTSSMLARGNPTTRCCCPGPIHRHGLTRSNINSSSIRPPTPRPSSPHYCRTSCKPRQVLGKLGPSSATKSFVPAGWYFRHFSTSCRGQVWESPFKAPKRSPGKIFKGEFYYVLLVKLGASESPRSINCFFFLPRSCSMHSFISTYLYPPCPFVVSRENSTSEPVSIET